MTPFENFTTADLELQYNVRLPRPDYDTVLAPDWSRRSEAARRMLDARLDMPYGNSSRQRLDFFRAGGPEQPTLIFFHGGYWQRGNKSFYSFLAAPFVEHGINVILVGYDLCPAVSISEIVQQARKAVSWIWRNAEALKIDKTRLTVMGHSAGGHLTAMMMGTQWPALDTDLPSDLIKAGILISPLTLLEPLRHCSIGTALKMTDKEAFQQSPMNNPPATDAPQLIACGGRETKEFHRQADTYAQTFLTNHRFIERYIVPDCDHFDELNALADEGHEFFTRSLARVSR